MKYILGAMIVVAHARNNVPHKTCTKGNDEICLTKTLANGTEVDTPGSCCMYFKVVDLPDTSNYSPDDLNMFTLL